LVIFHIISSQCGAGHPFPPSPTDIQKVLKGEETGETLRMDVYWHKENLQ
jgi:hypothetical protein